MEERGLIMAGIGGQGVLLATKLLGAAATTKGLYCLHFGKFGGEIRGTEITCTLTISGQQIDSPPIRDSVHIGIVMNPLSCSTVAEMIEPGGWLFYNSSLITDLPDVKPGVTIVPVPAALLSKESTGTELGSSLVMISAVSIIAGLGDPDDMIAELPTFLPLYRHKTIPSNTKAIEAGKAFAANPNWAVHTEGREAQPA